jgi:hypothetical protein
MMADGSELTSLPIAPAEMCIRLVANGTKFAFIRTRDGTVILCYVMRMGPTRYGCRLHLRLAMDPTWAAARHQNTFFCQL